MYFTLRVSVIFTFSFQISILLETSLYKSRYSFLLIALAFRGEIELWSTRFFFWQDSRTAAISWSVATVGTFVKGRRDTPDADFGKLLVADGSDSFRSLFFLMLLLLLSKLSMIPSESLSPDESESSSSTILSREFLTPLPSSASSSSHSKMVSLSSFIWNKLKQVWSL